MNVDRRRIETWEKRLIESADEISKDYFIGVISEIPDEYRDSIQEYKLAMLRNSIGRIKDGKRIT